MQNWGERMFSIRQAKMQRLQNAKQSNVDNLNNIIREASRHFRNKKK
jgi:hypothetical protein